MKLETVKVPKDEPHVFCFKRDEVIADKDCDNYEHNLECDKNHTLYGRTHRKTSYAGYKLHGISGNILNSCKYCLENHDIEEFILPPEATKIRNAKKKQRGIIQSIFRGD